MAGQYPDSYSVTVAPAAEPVSAAEAKAHLRIADTESDSLITSLIAAARQRVEEFTRRALVTQTRTAVWDCPPGGDELCLPGAPLASVTSVKQYAPGGSATTVDAADYTVDTVGEPGRVVLESGSYWPLQWAGGNRRANALEVVYVCGYGNAAAVPEWAKHAIKEIVRARFDGESHVERDALEMIRERRVLRVA